MYKEGNTPEKKFAGVVFQIYQMDYLEPPLQGGMTGIPKR